MADYSENSSGDDGAMLDDGIDWPEPETEAYWRVLFPRPLPLDQVQRLQAAARADRLAEARIPQEIAAALAEDAPKEEEPA